MIELLKRTTMKFKGAKPGPYTDYVVIPRAGQKFVFELRAVLSYEPFDKLVPQPKPPIVSRPGIGDSANVEDEGFIKQLTNYNLLRNAWTYITAIRHTEGLEWETVDYANPNTWVDWDKEMSASGFSDGEIVHLMKRIWEVNGQNEEKLEEARQSFLRTLTVQENTSQTSQRDEQNYTLSGPLPPPSGSNPQA